MMGNDPIVCELLSVFERTTSMTVMADLINALDQVAVKPKSSELTQGSEADIKDEQASILGQLENTSGGDVKGLVESTVSSVIEPSDIAFGIDTNALLQMARRAKMIDSAVDFLNNRNNKPVILPGQVMQEFWNNKVGNAKETSKHLWERFDSFKNYVEDQKENFEKYIEDIEQILNKFDSEYRGFYSEQIIRDVKDLLSKLENNITVHFCPRRKFYDVAAHRRRTKTPPGFEDKRDTDGDFFVWLDFLYGLMKEKSEGKDFDKIVFVTNERKADWVSGEAAHPILVSEVWAIFQKPFEIWNCDKFLHVVKREMS